ncbi:MULTISPECIES: hypothetical protein [Pandoraea]|uniref:hypothetical protein n=1 Tax=Pandoraea TaxID=93217 RepID=UPI00124191C9|nr:MULTISPECIES: hypothetical protein [Pandoraea]
MIEVVSDGLLKVFRAFEKVVDAFDTRSPAATKCSQLPMQRTAWLAVHGQTKAGVSDSHPDIRVFLACGSNKQRPHRYGTNGMVCPVGGESNRAGHAILEDLRIDE